MGRPDHSPSNRNPLFLAARQLAAPITAVDFIPVVQGHVPYFINGTNVKFIGLWLKPTFFRFFDFKFLQNIEF
jgi:hypothetical protein